MIALTPSVPAVAVPRSSAHQNTAAFDDMTYDGVDRRMSSAIAGTYVPTALILRRLPLNTTAEAVRTMLLFAKDLQDTEVVPNEHEEDQGFATAIARFASMMGASEAQAMLDGKPNMAGHASMIVDVAPGNVYGPGYRRHTIDPSSTRPRTQAASPLGRTTRYMIPFDSLNSLSPPPATSSNETALSDGGGSLAGRYQPQSPRERARISGKSVIDEDGGDEETDGLLRDPVGYMKQDKSLANSHRPNNHRGTGLPVQAFNALSLNTSISVSGSLSYSTNPRSAMPVQSPHTPFSPGGAPYMTGNPYLRHNFPPVNPADQNPPCNTLYVGNLPMDTSEDELKAMFSKQRGYKRLCFRTKQNGPMCFVEFEDVSFATKALNELYGAQLHNSVKGGIRLSFSKNPLGVRSGQAGSIAGPPTPLGSPSTPFLNGKPMSAGSFSTASGPPPGLSVPSGYPPNVKGPKSPYSGSSIRNAQVGPGSDTSTGGGMYPDYMMGR